MLNLSGIVTITDEETNFYCMFSSQRFHELKEGGAIRNHEYARLTFLH